MFPFLNAGRSRRNLLGASAGALLLVLGVGCPTRLPSKRADRPEASRAVPGAILDPARVSAELVDAHNQVRERAGLAPLRGQAALMDAAEAHAADMARHRRMSHTGRDGSTPFRRMGRAGYSYRSAAENVAAGQRSVMEVMRDWEKSPGHRRNILGKYHEIGTGYATDEDGTPYWCVTFGTPTASGF